jgi:alkanesulfonate monooxygenase SsuD/methylene tetrahydromethanopterin reductase-like flavin-dependent oxidoreductase (luciferase family)
MRIGVLVETEEGLDWDAWRGTYGAAERLGFESVWISDHLQSPWSSARHGLDSWTALAVAAAETHRLVLGPLVSPITFREPAIIARMAESLQTLSGGRFVVGLGLGWNRDEHVAAGIQFPVVSERSKRLIETIDRIRSQVGAPILLGGRGSRETLPIVARYADEWNVTTSSAAEFRRVAGQLDGLCGEIGRNPQEIRRSAAMGLLIGRDTADLRDRAERMRSHVQPFAEVSDVVEAAKAMGWVVGTPQEVVARLHALAEAGIERAIFGHYDVTDVHALELVAEAVL